jgi:2-keto-3-deoxy-L-rhamnonate aldolase RhmA
MLQSTSLWVTFWVTSRGEEPPDLVIGASRAAAKRGTLDASDPWEECDAYAIGENRAKKMLKANELVLCMGVNQLRTPNITMIAAACGFDAVYIDLEDNPTSLETAAGVCVAALGIGITPIARVTSHDPHDATRILDCGAQGVMVPHVQNAAEANSIVEACLYAPKGHRSAFGSGHSSAMPRFHRRRSAKSSTSRRC